MRIVAASIRDVLRVRSVKIVPDADASIILIAGDNGNGKSSVLTSLSMAFGGKRAIPRDPVRHGAEEGDITIDLDNGMRIHLVVARDGTSKLELTDGEGALRSPQERLNALVGSRTLDPMAFVLLDAAAQRVRLLELIDSDKQIATLDERYARIYDKRTDVGRDMKKAEGELARLGPDKVVGVAIDVAALSAERAALSERQQEGAKLTARKELATRKADEARSLCEANALAISNLTRQLDELRAKSDSLDTNWQTCQRAASEASEAVDKSAEEWLALQPRRAEIDAELARADAHNRSVYAAEAENKRRREAAEIVARIEAQKLEQTKALDKIEAQKLAILRAAKLPVDGLGVDAKGVTLNGVPFTQASGAEQIRVALALAIAASPQLDDIWIKDGSLLDLNSLKMVADHAQAAGKRLWIERVGTRDPGAIVIHDGLVSELPSGEPA